MQEIAMITEHGVFPAGSPAPFGDYSNKRLSVRVVVVDNNGRVALNHYQKKPGYDETWYMPGGGVEKDEDIISALHREVVEEVGVKLRDVKEIGVVRRYFPVEKLESLDYCFMARVDGEKGVPNMIQRDIDQGMETIWVYPDDVLPKINLEEAFAPETTKHKQRTLVMRQLTVFLLQYVRDCK